MSFRSGPLILKRQSTSGRMLGGGVRRLESWGDSGGWADALVEGETGVPGQRQVDFFLPFGSPANMNKRLSFGGGYMRTMEPWGLFSTTKAIIRNNRKEHTGYINFYGLQRVLFSVPIQGCCHNLPHWGERWGVKEVFLKKQPCKVGRQPFLLCGYGGIM